MVTCPGCGSVVPPDSISRELGMAQCPSCDRMFELSEAPPPPTADPAASEPVASAARPESTGTITLSPPAGVEVARSSSGMVVTYRWPRLRGVGLLVFAALWFAFLSVFVVVGTASGDWMFLLVPTIHALVGTGVAYTGVSYLLNHTTVIVGKGVLEIEHGPVPWPGARKVASSSLRQLYVDRVVRQTKNGQNVTYDVRAQIDGGKDIKLISGFDDAQPARFLERAIESFLGIENREVPGEHWRLD
ncbi:MAG: hypothetical protein H6737_06500 [Alphaproteobacteria bacterium]|nr:hypothetical protein [Alphaproteobacteria bacterium]